jgi:hypothetical protein
MRRSVGLALALMLAAGVTMLVGPRSGAGELPPCPTVTTNTVLTSDCIAPLTVAADRVTVNLNGHTVMCAPAAADVGVDITGHDRVRVMFGTVTGCDAGVSILDGNRNVVVGIQAVGDIVGIAVADSSHNQILFNTASGALIGISQIGGPGNLIGANRVVGGAVGIGDGVGPGSRITGNQVIGNATFGITMAGSGSRVVANRVEGNATGIAAAFQAANNTIIGNVAQSNGTDLVDGNPGCGSNRWFFNWFTTASQPCIH